MNSFLSEWQKANDLSKEFITVKKNPESVFGRELVSDAMVRKGVDTLKAYAESGPGAFHRLISSLPEAELQPAIASILQHAASQGEKERRRPPVFFQTHDAAECKRHRPVRA